MIYNIDILKGRVEMFDFIILGIVHDKALTGYDIKKEIEGKIGNFYKASHGKLYPALKKLTDKSLLDMREDMRGSRLKKYYRTTELGRAAFLEWLSSPVCLNAGLEIQLAHIFFYGKLPTEIRDKRLQEYEFYVQQQLEQLNAIAKELTNENMDDKDYFEISTLYFGIQSAHNALRWLRHIKEQKPFSQFLFEKMAS
jgi:DNA-binding PadR family transcriptional regulator